VVDEAQWAETLADGMVTADADGTVRIVNAAAAQLLGLAPHDAVGRAIADVLALDDLRGNTWAGCMRPYDGLATRTQLVERAWYRADGTQLLVTGRLVRERPGGRVVRVVVSLRSGRARERVDRDRSDLLATAAHELRSPLTGIKGFTATLLSRWDRFSDDQRRFMLQTVDADADRLARLISELLDTARIDAGRLALRREPVHLVTVAERIAAGVGASGGRRTEVLVTGNVPVIWADGDKVARVLTNLVDNAQRHGRGTVRLSLTTESGADGTPGVCILVEDEGDGVPADIRDRVFVRFWRRGPHDGSGLGLYIVCGLVEAHDGEVTMLDRPTGGARVRIWLPVAEPETLAADRPRR
jgi:PAS domain S-box-containing protein